MATRTTSRKANTSQQAAAANRLVCCLDCQRARLHRYGNDPILSACQAKPQPGNERFPYEVQVAAFMRRCADWKQDTGNKGVEQRSTAA